MEVTGMNQRIAERRHEVSEDKARGRLRWIIRLVAVAAVVGLIVWLVNSPVLAVRDVSVTGEERSDPATIASEAGVAPGTPAIFVHAGDLEHTLMTSDPWIEKAKVTVTWPGEVEIDVVERVPVAVVATANGKFLASEDGVLLDRVDGETPDSPVIVTDAVEGMRAGNRVGHEPTAAAIAFVGGLSPELRRSASVKVVGEDVSAEIGGVSVVMGRPRDMAAKAAAVEALIGTGIEPGSRIDVTAPTRPAVASPQSLLQGERKTLEQAQPSD